MEESSHREEVAEAFRQFDSNGDGTITQEELAEVFQSLDPEKYNEETIAELFEAMDNDGNGEVLLEEFLEWVFGGSDTSKAMQEVIAAIPEGGYGDYSSEVDDEEIEEEEEAGQDEVAELAVGDSVRVRDGVTPKHKWGKVKPGDVGIVEAVAGESCRVNFPRQPRWTGLCSEMEKVDMELAEGDVVRVRKGVDPPKYKWGKVKKGEHGTLTKINGSTCRVDFLSQKNWKGHLPDIEKVPESERKELEVGDHVRVKDNINMPKFKWRKAVPGEVGSIVEVQEEGKVLVAFRSNTEWPGFLPELERVPAEPGWHVRVRADVEEPTLGWQDVESGDVGTLAALEDEGRCRVNFEKAENWEGLLSELELVPVVVGDQVRIKPSISRPKRGWGKVKREDVGELVEIVDARCKVDFPGQSGFKCFYRELERVDAEREATVYPQVGNRVQVKEEVKKPKFKWGKVRHGHVGEVSSVDGLKCEVDFPVYKGSKLWRGWLPDLEAVEPDDEEQGEDWSAQGFLPGRIVRVKEDVDPPKYKWAGVKPGTQGRIREIIGDTGKIEFPRLKKLWTAHMPEMELVIEEGEEEEEEDDGEEGELFNDGHAEAGLDGKEIPVENWLRPGRGEGVCDVTVGQMVKVKDSVEKPKAGWGKVQRGDEGELKSINGNFCKVAFERQKGLWNGRVNEMEAVNASASEAVRVFGDIAPQDLKQGRLGDCWLIAALASLAEFPDAVRLPFQQTDWSKKGRYTIKLFCLESKTWKTFRIDDRLATQNGGLEFAKVSSEGELWPVLLEKAFAALFGSYKNLEGGWGPTGWAIITGCEEAYKMRKKKDTDDWRRYKMVWKKNGSPRNVWSKWSDGSSGKKPKPTEEILDMLVEWDSSNYLMCASAHLENTDSKSVEGIVQSHEYSLIRVVKDAAGSGTSLLQLRNPWGRSEWQGPWSDNSGKWDEHPEVKEELWTEAANDGLFWMAIEDFARIYDSICVLEREMPPKRDA